MRIPITPGKGQGKPFVYDTMEPKVRLRRHMFYANAIWLMALLQSPCGDL